MKLLLERCRQHFCTENLYKVLKTDPKSTAKEVRKAYLELALKYHPDKVPEKERKFATEKFKVITQVYSIINDEEKRKNYDAIVASRQPRKKPSIWREREQPTCSQPTEQTIEELVNRFETDFEPFDDYRSTFMDQFKYFDEHTRKMEEIMCQMRHIGNLLHRFKDIRAEMYHHSKRKIPKYSEDY
ncbi:DnaJ domain [Cinara cedri]|uniref:DnaJ domain n=1 Tax=Cinara cedri TaxID=506608 RepID=A0A5E4MUL7_9HEMI|nr:DnaJ domain [Cinara cedri]